MKIISYWLLLPALVFSQIGVSPLRYIDQYERPMTSYEEWSSRITGEPFTIGTVYKTGFMGLRQELIDVVVYAPIYTGISESLNVYVSDLEAEGYIVQVDTMRGWTADSLRDHFATLLGNDLVGAVLIGNIPFAWYEESGGEGREEFPIDLYLMDLDGTWIDNDANGLFEDHTGNKEPEIWVGRIYASPMTWGNEIYLVNNYLSKVHRYRNGGYTVPQKALAYVDDDWYGFGDCALDYLYDTVDVVRDYNTTVATDFRSRFSDPYEWVQICSHSSPWGNTFKYTGGYAGTVFNFEVWFANPPFLFVNLFQCSGTRFFEENYCGGCYIFGPDNGLLAIGSAKVGSMLHFSDFYGPLNTGISVGEAFRQWFAQWGITDPSWFYGMCICGDPVLKPKQSQRLSTKYWRQQTDFHDQINWTSPEPVDLDPETDGYVSATIDNTGRIWAGWVTGRSNTYGRTEICTAYRENGVWSAPEIIDPYEYWDFWPAMTCNSTGNAVLAWSRCYGRNYDVFVATHDGSNWQTPFRVSSKATDALHPAMITDGDGRLWVTLERWNHLNGDIYCRFHDGSSWNSMFAVTVGDRNDYKPAMATDSTGRGWTVWTSERYQDNNNIYVKNYNANSGHWENMYRVTGNLSQDQDPAICVAGDGTVFVAWTTWRHGNSDIYFSQYDGTWSSPQAVTVDDNKDEQCALVVDQDGYVWCVWQSDRNGDWEILAMYYKDGQWQGLSNVSNDPGRDILPATVGDNDRNLWVFFQTERNGNWDIYTSSILADLIEPEVTVITPNGGEVWDIGELDTIRWIATDNVSVDSISIYYSTNNGSDWLEVAHGEDNDSLYLWTIPATPSTQCLVRIVVFDGFPNISEDLSDAVFTIRDAIPPSVTLYHPNGGEVYYVGDIDTIRWLATDNIAVDSVALEYSADSGMTWVYIASPGFQDTIYEWTVPNEHSTECLMRVRAFDAGDNMGEDISDSLFSIIDNLSPEVSVIIPNGGEVWYWNEMHTIEWTSIDNVGIDSLDIHLSLDAGATYPLLIMHFDGNDSTYDWTVPETTSYECLIKVTAYDVAGLMTLDESDSLFAIGEFGIEEMLGMPGYFAFDVLSANPFIGRCEVKLAIPYTMSVECCVYDVQGRIIERVMDAKLNRGFYTLIWDSKSTASGVYFIYVRTDRLEKIEKVVKLK